MGGAEGAESPTTPVLWSACHSSARPALSEPQQRVRVSAYIESQGCLWGGIRSSWRKPYTEGVSLPFIHLCATSCLHIGQLRENEERVTSNLPQQEGTTSTSPFSKMGKLRPKDWKGLTKVPQRVSA